MHPHYTPEQIDFFWSHVNRSVGPDACWPWTGSRTPRGYGYTTSPRMPQCHTAQAQRAHRVAWSVANGPIPAGLFVLHHCDNRLCCNPAHLFVGTLADNNADMVAKGRHMRGAGHYARLHPERLARGEHHGQHRLTALLVQQIRQRYAGGETELKALASDYGVNSGTIYCVVHRLTWRQVP